MYRTMFKGYVCEHLLIVYNIVTIWVTKFRVNLWLTPKFGFKKGQAIMLKKLQVCMMVGLTSELVS